MPSSKDRIELLAPAKNAEIGISAINCGADAVYIGAEKFGARQLAGNNLAEIEKLVKHAHLFYTRVYVALNTLLTDRELDEAFSLIRSLHAIGIDGLIIQDLGLLELPLPPVPLIASTQMNNDSLEKILFLEKVGFSRVILPREMSLDEIRAIRAKTSIRLECFVHGALCVSYSGQCYLSYAIGGRSANRGCCAQPCRRFYSLIDEKGSILVKDRYLLSLKDLNRAENLRAMIDAGVTSFKIEGRLKDAAYVKNTVAFYRKELDRILSGAGRNKSSSGRTTFEFVPDPCKTFNRGFTDFGLKNGSGPMSCPDTPKSMGEKIGKVAKIAKDHFTLVATHDLQSGDGICFFDARGTLCGSVINHAGNGSVYPDKMTGVTPGTLIYRNHNHAFIKLLSAKNSCERRIGVSFTLSETPEGFSLTARDEDGNEAAAATAAEKQVAEKKTAAEDTLKKQLSKVHDTVFSIHELTYSLKETYFIPVSVLNALRREALTKLLEEREKNRLKEKGGVLRNEVPYPATEVDYLGNCLNQKAAAFYRRHGVKIVEMAAESGLPMQGRRLMYSKYCVKRDLHLCKKETGPLFLVDEDGRKYRLEFDCSSCRMSVFASY